MYNHMNNHIYNICTIIIQLPFVNYNKSLYPLMMYDKVCIPDDDEHCGVNLSTSIYCM